LRVVNADRAMEIAAVRYVEEQRRRASRDRMPVPEPRDGATLANLEPPV
jgi:hypothetical protein